MRKLIIVVLSFSMIISINAQKKNVDKALGKISSGKLTEAYDMLMPALENPESKDNARTWYALGLMYQKAEMQQDQAILAKTKSAFDEAYTNYKKARTLDPKNICSIDINKSLNDIYNFCINHGNEDFNARNYARASNYFSFALVVNEDPGFTRQHDSIVSLLNYYAGLSAYYGAIKEDKDTAAKSVLLQRARKHYETAVKMNYKDDFLYRSLHYVYLFTYDTLNAEKILLKGYDIFPDSSLLIIDIVNMYIQTKKYDKVLKYLDPAIKKMSNNAQLVYTKAQMYDQMGKWEDAEKNYLETIKIKPDMYDAYFNLGVLYYNWATEYNNQAAATDLKQQDKYKTLMDKRDENYKKALEPFKKAYQLKPDDVEPLVNLKKIYSRLKMKKELDEITEKINKM
jgi:tetratricopeptide (TPR) repeat protein